MSITAVRMVGPHRGTTGYERHVREYVRQFHRLGIAVELRDLPGWNPAAQPTTSGPAWFQDHYAPVAADVVLHFSMPNASVPEPRAINVLHTMIESNRITRTWLDHSLRFRLVVVPSTSSRDAWLAAGMPPARVVVCPQGVDADLFDGSAPPMPLSLPDGRPISGFRTRFLNVAMVGPRKNLLGLVRAWLRATTDRDDAVLVMKCGPAPGEWLDILFRRMEQQARAIGKPFERAAPILLVNRSLTDAELPGLYTAATHYISMSHGEGWDQPMHEAAATDLRLIAPDHSAYRDYISEEVADVIPSRPVPIVFGGDPATLLIFAGAQWWEPDEDVAAQYIRAAIDGTAPRKASPRERIALGHTWEDSARELLSVLDGVRAGRSPRRFWPLRPARTRG